MEDKIAEDYIMSARKHLFMANNLYTLFIFIKDKKDSSIDLNTDVVSFFIILISFCFCYFIDLRFRIVEAV
jgi:hypothetical protein